MPVAVKTNNGKDVVEVSLDSGKVTVEKDNIGNITITATSNDNPTKPEVVHMFKEYKTLSSENTYLDFKKAKDKFVELYFDPSVISMIGETERRPENSTVNYKAIAISVGFKTKELMETSDYIPNEFCGYQVVKRVVGQFLPY